MAASLFDDARVDMTTTENAGALRGPDVSYLYDLLHAFIFPLRWQRGESSPLQSIFQCMASYSLRVDYIPTSVWPPIGHAWSILPSMAVRAASRLPCRVRRVVQIERATWCSELVQVVNIQCGTYLSVSLCMT
jgi:hypothetical protein